MSFVGVVYGEVWEDSTDPNDEYNSHGVTVTFNFPLNINEIDIQNMVVEIEAYDVNRNNNPVMVDGEYVGVLEVGGKYTVETTIITIDGENAKKYLSDNSVTISIGKKELLRIDSIKITVGYIPKSSPSSIIKAPIPLGAIILTLMTIPIIALKR
ncbi:hypothetical protein [Methanotorris formicicus]|uniref:PEFG-CTERM sorting domain-containing protein n=1 Tax=Methanotorris formicicus Mc-S-70 TaxID=647171 RepID=H1L1U0_9EURY|nr:hypothetical protein [Methanotorris formicicus]EHP82881.1 hypothetical protein MetfoDRAFT_2014 [Methanotorris formicicus Mc-S-70]